MNENWRPVIGFEDLYEVSDQGRIRNSSGKMLAGAGGRYLHVTLCRDGRRFNVNIHTAVAEAFLGPRPERQEVRHLDDVKINNVLENLAYGTKSENSHDAVRNGLHTNAAKTHCPQNHAYDQTNTGVTKQNIRYCRACMRDRARERRRRTS